MASRSSRSRPSESGVGFAQGGYPSRGVVGRGGIATDVAGSRRRLPPRVPVVHIATTLLGQIDAAIGGNRVNRPRARTSWAPAAAAGVSATQRYWPRSAARAAQRLGELPSHSSGGDSMRCLSKARAACVAIKAAVVAGDERDGSEGLFKYGHTGSRRRDRQGCELRHETPWRWTHLRAGWLRSPHLPPNGSRAPRVWRLRPSGPSRSSTRDELVRALARDKKARDGRPSCSMGPEASRSRARRPRDRQTTLDRAVGPLKARPIVAIHGPTSPS